MQAPICQVGLYRLVEPREMTLDQTVYLARHRILGRAAVIEILPNSTALERETRGRIIRNLAAAQSIRHPSVVATYEFGETEEGVIYSVRESVGGSSLGAAISGRRLSEHAAAYFTGRIARALAVAHHSGTIHGNLDLSKVILGPRAVNGPPVKVVGFGLAAGTREEDLHALGAMLLQMLTGRSQPPDGSRLDAIPSEAGDLAWVASTLLDHSSAEGPRSAFDAAIFLSSIERRTATSMQH